MVIQVNGGVLPDSGEPRGWVERIIAGRFSAQTVIVTGGASGIGRATAVRVAKEGGRVEFAASVPDAGIVPVAGAILASDGGWSVQ